MNHLELKMKYLAHLAALASWVFFIVMGYFGSNTLEGGASIFWIGSVVFYCIGGYLLVARQGKLARSGILVLLPGLMCGLAMVDNGGLAEIGSRNFPLTFKVVDAETQKPIPNALVRILLNEDNQWWLEAKEKDKQTKTEV